MHSLHRYDVLAVLDDRELLLDGVICGIVWASGKGAEGGSFANPGTSAIKLLEMTSFSSTICVGIYLHDGKEVKEGERDQSGRLGVGTRMGVGDTRWVGGLSAWLRDACLC
jgi:hypothetical protein